MLAEDFYQFFTGGESMIGDMVAKWPLLGDVISGVADAIKLALGFAGDLGGMLLSIATMDFGRLLESFQNLGNRIIGVFRDVGRAIYDALPSWAIDAMGSAFGAAESAGGFISEQASRAGAAVSSMPLFGAPALPGVPLMMPMQAAQVASSSSTSKQEDNRVYHITGTDIGEVKRVLNEKNAYAAKTIDTGTEY